MSTRAYLDHAASGLLREKAQAAWLELSGEAYANPSASHQEGRKAKAALTRLRKQAGELLGRKARELIFTSGGTEANNAALRGYAGARPSARIFFSPLEHPSVSATLERIAQRGPNPVVSIAVKPDGVFDLADLRQREFHSGDLVVLQAVNNETGILQPLEETAKWVHAQGGRLFCDAVQASCTLDLAALLSVCDLFSLSSHKFGGPKGVGLLGVNEGVDFIPDLLGGQQEAGRRAGTETLPGVAGMLVALIEAQATWPKRAQKDQTLWEHFAKGLQAQPACLQILGTQSAHSPHIFAALFASPADELLMQLDLKGVSASSGSACQVGNPEPSPVLLAMGIQPEQARGLVRFSFGPETGLAEVDLALRAMGEIYG